MVSVDEIGMVRAKLRLTLPSAKSYRGDYVGMHAGTSYCRLASRYDTIFLLVGGELLTFLTATLQTPCPPRDDRLFNQSAKK